MENNYVHLVGTVKRAEEASGGRIEFTIEVPDRKGTNIWFDCVCSRRSEAFAALDGFVNEGEPMEVMGHLEKHTTNKSMKVGHACSIDARATDVVVYVDEVITED